MKQPHKLSRRHWLKQAGCAAATLLLGSGCGRSHTAASTAVASPEPMLADLTTTTAQLSEDVSSAATTVVAEQGSPQPPDGVTQPVPSAATTSPQDDSTLPTEPTVQNTSSTTATSTHSHGTTSASDSLDYRIGQMLLVGFRGLAVGPDHPIARDIREHGLGGVVLFDVDVPTSNPVRNIASPQQVKQLVAALQGLAATPLLVAIDQEGGRVARLNPTHGFPATSSAQQLGATGDPQQTGQQASLMAQMLATLGINLNLAPVVDLNRTPDNPVIGQLERSFGADPQGVIQHALAFINAHHEQGMLCALKHFPGHGSATGDTHLGVVDVTETWDRTELEPFRAIIQAGLADMIMSAHVFNAHLDPEHPASLSPPTITDLLRGQLGYNGIIVCDDIQMGAIQEQYGFAEALRRAIEAGIDLIMIGNNTVWEDGVTLRAIQAIRHFVQQGVLREERIEQSYQRIQRLKKRLGNAG